MTLTELGLSRRQREHAEELRVARPDGAAARVVRQDRERFLVQMESGEMTAQVSGRFRHEARSRAELPAVGGFVFATPRPGGASASIHSVLARSGSFSRKVPGETTEEQVVVANIDVAFLVSGLDDDFNVRRIERYTTTAWNSGATPVVVLNKADLVDDEEGIRFEVEAVAPGVDVVFVSALEGTGIQVLRTYLPEGQTAVLLGSSGAGKSTIINALLGEDRLATGAVREDDSRGRHTTTARQMIFLPGGGMIIDTPGMRELQLWTDQDGFTDSFSDVESLAMECRFSDCVHETEPGCAVRAALDRGDLAPDRFNSYLKLRKEAAWLERRKSESSYEDRQHEKSLHKLYKSIQQHNRKLK